MEKKRILVLSQYFYPEEFRINDICKEWVKRGYQVTVLTGIPNYPQGKFYKGYGFFQKRKERYKEIDIIRIPIVPRGEGSIQLAFNYLSFVFSGLLWTWFTRRKADLVFIFEVSPMTQALPGVWYAKKNKIPCILYVTDLWPENVEIITGIHNKLFLGIIQKMVDYIYKRSSRILTCSNSFITAIKKRGISPEKIEFWPQYAEDIYKPSERISSSEIPDDGVLNLVFAGNIGYAQGLGILPQAAEKLKKGSILVRFNVIGDGRYMPDLKKEIERRYVEEYFNFIDRKPAEQIPVYLAAADALLITLSKSEVFSITIPAKTQSCMACGRPILVSADGEVQDIIRRADAGLTSASEDVEGFVKNIMALASMTNEERNRLGQNALLYSETHFDKDMLLNRMDEIFKKESQNVKV